MSDLKELIDSGWLKNVKSKLKKKQAQLYLYHLWENGVCNSNFTEDHSEYDSAIEDLINNGIRNFNINKYQTK